MKDETIAQVRRKSPWPGHRARPSGVRRGAQALQRDDRQAAAAHRAMRRCRRRDRGGEFRPRQQAARSPFAAAATTARVSASVDDGLVIDLSTMKGVRVDPKKQDGESGPGLHHRRRRSCDPGVRSGRAVRDHLDDRRRRADAERRARLSQPPIWPRRRQSARGGRGAGRRQIRHRLRNGECGSASGPCAAAAEISAS